MHCALLSEQNGVAERLNRTLTTTAYIKNRAPTRALREKVSPYERWYGHIPDLKHFKVFGCAAYAQRQSKGQAKQKGGEAEVCGIQH